MKTVLLIFCQILSLAAAHSAPEDSTAEKPVPSVETIIPPAKDFFAKRVDYYGIPILAAGVVEDRALQEAWQRLDLLLRNQVVARENLVKAGAELHIIGRNQETTDLPEWRHDKGKKLAEYNGLTRDERTRGMGGLLTSCGEENLLKLPEDRYRGRDICLHEFAHNVRNAGMNPEVRKQFDVCWKRSLEKNRWVGSYAGSNADEFFAELTMWYFGTHGDLSMKGDKPVDGAKGLRDYDPEAFQLFEDFYSGRLQVAPVNKPPRKSTVR